MSTLILRLAAPLQAWGLDNKFGRRGTMREPTKSGVIGLLAAALGRSRDDDMDDLSSLRFGVRIDQPGQLLRDYHTASYDKNKPPYVTERYYLSDAVFVVGLEGNELFLKDLDEALLNPIFPLYLGRRSCPPSGELSLGIQELQLEEALFNVEWKAGDWYKRRIKENPRLTLVLDAKQPGMLSRQDLPLSFSQSHRKYSLRYVDDKAEAVSVSNDYMNKVFETEHDPLMGLEDEHVSVKD